MYFALIFKSSPICIQLLPAPQVKGPNLADWISADWNSMQMLLEDIMEVSAALMLFSQQDT